MIRTVFYLLLSIFLLTLLRYVIGTLAKGVSGLLHPKGTTRQAELAGELKRDPVCGTFVSTSASVKKIVGGEVVHFCSEACRDKYKDV